jgi:hypothetical protein
MNNELEERINALEIHVRRQRWIGAVAVLCVVAACTTPLITNEVYEVLKAKKIEIIGADGKVVVGLSAWDHGGAVWTYNNDGVAVAAMVAAEEGGELVAYNNEAETLAGLSASDNGGRMEVYNNEGTAVAAVSAYENGGVVRTGNKHGKTKATMGTPEGWPEITTYNFWDKKASGLEVSIFGGGMIYANDLEGTPKVKLVSGEYGGAIGVTNKTGEQVVTLGADVYGNGTVGAWNREGKGRTLTPQ